jgi:membrane protease subunit (stomatin/prohibitin family)
MADSKQQQSTLFRGIYEFEDPSGVLAAAKVPAVGSVDLYSGTAVIVRPNQTALFIYKGQIADILKPGTHSIQTENLPLLTKLANWKFGFQSPLRCELVFVSSQLFTSRRWGTPQPVLASFDGFGTVPIRAFGNFSVNITGAQKFYTKLMGSRSVFPIADLDEYLQGLIVETLPAVLSEVKDLTRLSQLSNEISKKIEARLTKELAESGLRVEKIQVLSAIPSKEVIQAMEAKTAISIIGSQKEYLLYKAATSLGQANDNQGNDPLQMMMGMMLGKGLLGGGDANERTAVPVPAANTASPQEKAALPARRICGACNHANEAEARFCSNCGKKV